MESYRSSLGRDVVSAKPTTAAERAKLTRQQQALEKHLRLLQSKLIVSGTSAHMVGNAAEFFLPQHYVDVVIERKIQQHCGYPCCTNALPSKGSGPRFTSAEIATRHKAVREKGLVLTEADDMSSYCSRWCHAASSYLRAQLSTIQPFSRLHDGRSYKVEVLTVDTAAQEREARARRGNRDEDVPGVRNADVGALQGQIAAQLRQAGINLSAIPRLGSDEGTATNTASALASTGPGADGSTSALTSSMSTLSLAAGSSPTGRIPSGGLSIVEHGGQGKPPEEGQDGDGDGVRAIQDVGAGSTAARLDASSVEGYRLAGAARTAAAGRKPAAASATSATTSAAAARNSVAGDSTTALASSQQVSTATPSSSSASMLSSDGFIDPRAMRKAGRTRAGRVARETAQAGNGDAAAAARVEQQLPLPHPRTPARKAWDPYSSSLSPGLELYLPGSNGTPIDSEDNSDDDEGDGTGLGSDRQGAGLVQGHAARDYDGEESRLVAALEARPHTADVASPARGILKGHGLGAAKTASPCGPLTDAQAAPQQAVDGAAPATAAVAGPVVSAEPVSPSQPAQPRLKPKRSVRFGAEPGDTDAALQAAVVSTRATADDHGMEVAHHAQATAMDSSAGPLLEASSTQQAALASGGALSTNDEPSDDGEAATDDDTSGSGSGSDTDGDGTAATYWLGRYVEGYTRQVVEGQGRDDSGGKDKGTGDGDHVKSSRKSRPRVVHAVLDRAPDDAEVEGDVGGIWLNGPVEEEGQDGDGQDRDGHVEDSAGRELGLVPDHDNDEQPRGLALGFGSIEAIGLAYDGKLKKVGRAQQGRGADHGNGEEDAEDDGQADDDDAEDDEDDADDEDGDDEHGEEDDDGGRRSWRRSGGLHSDEQDDLPLPVTTSTSHLRFFGITSYGLLWQHLNRWRTAVTRFMLQGRPVHVPRADAQVAQDGREATPQGENASAGLGAEEARQLLAAHAARREFLAGCLVRAVAWLGQLKLKGGSSAADSPLARLARDTTTVTPLLECLVRTWSMDEAVPRLREWEWRLLAAVVLAGLAGTGTSAVKVVRQAGSGDEVGSGSNAAAEAGGRPVSTAAGLGPDHDRLVAQVVRPLPHSQEQEQEHEVQGNGSEPTRPTTDPARALFDILAAVDGDPAWPAWLQAITEDASLWAKRAGKRHGQNKSSPVASATVPGRDEVLSLVHAVVAGYDHPQPMFRRAAGPTQALQYIQERKPQAAPAAAGGRAGQAAPRRPVVANPQADPDMIRRERAMLAMARP